MYRAVCLVVKNVRRNAYRISRVVRERHRDQLSLHDDTRAVPVMGYGNGCCRGACVNECVYLKQDHVWCL